MKLEDFVKLPDVPWSMLGAIGRSPAVRLTILVPVLGYILLLNHEFLKLFQLMSTQDWMPTTSLSMAPPVKLILTYLGLCCLGFASAIFVLRCPSPPKSYLSDIAFAEATARSGDFGSDTVLLSDIRDGLLRWGKIADIDVEKIPQRQRKMLLGVVALFEILIDDSTLKNYLRRKSEKDDIGSEVLLRTLQADGYLDQELLLNMRYPLSREREGLAKVWYRMEDISLPVSRGAVTAFYGLGFVFLAVPTLWTIAEVILVIPKALFH